MSTVGNSNFSSEVGGGGKVAEGEVLKSPTALYEHVSLDLVNLNLSADEQLKALKQAFQKLQAVRCLCMYVGPRVVGSLYSYRLVCRFVCLNACLPAR